MTLAIAPAGFADGDHMIGTVAAIGETGDPCARETAESIAARLGAELVAPGEARPTWSSSGRSPAPPTAG